VAQATAITTTITGTIISGTDVSGLFTGTPGTDLTGGTFELVIVFDDALGTETTGVSCGSTPCFTEDSLTGGLLGESVLTVTVNNGSNGNSVGSFTFGSLPYVANGTSSGILREVTGSIYASSVTFQSSEHYANGFGSYFAGGVLPAVGTILTPDPDWRTSFRDFNLDPTRSLITVVIDNGTGIWAFMTLVAQTITVDGTSTTAAQPQPKANGNCPCNGPGQPTTGAPITIGTGNMFEQAIDYTTPTENRLSFSRYYNSLAPNTTLIPKMLGTQWTSNYDRYIVPSKAGASVERADGRGLTFTMNGGTLTSDSDVDVELTQSGKTWTLTDTDDTVETYTTATTNVGGLEVLYGRLASIKARNGYTQTLSYDASNELLSVTDSYHRSLSFTYAGGLLQTVTTPDGLVLTYGYTGNLLTSVSYSTTAQTSLTYLYGNAAFPAALTGIIDENGNRFASWTYDAQGRALSSQHGAGADLTTVAYDDTTGNRTVTNALGQQEVYKFTTLQGVPKVTEIDRIATATTAAATRLFTYDANGYQASQTDWNGTKTTYINNAHGEPTTIVEALGTPQARTTAVTWHPSFHLPLSIVTPGLTTAFNYDASGELLTKTLTDTTATIVPYSTIGTTRTWTNTWANFLLASTKGPRTDVAQLTSFTYDASGALTSVTNALGQATKITAHTGGGLPETIVDPNGVTTNLTYNARQWLLTSVLSTTAGPLTTTLSYDAAGNLVKTTLPDGSALTNSYDTAHRLTAVTDLFNQSASFTLDANGDRTETDLLNSASAAQRKHFDSFDALGRMLKDIGGVGQTTAYAYDANGNALTVTDPLARVTQQAFDPLNRRIRTIDAAGGITKIVYDPHDRPVTVVDPNSGSTTFVYDGFGDVIQRISPDTGKTVYRYDLAGNLTQSVDARGAIANYTYDALNRVVTTTYPADAAENVAYSYDQSGHGFGIGRLTSVTDAAGSLSRSYDERGNMLTEKRIHGAATMLTSNTYDAASRVASISYPSGWKVTYTRDLMGRISATKATAPGGVTQTIASAIGYQPFGPVNALTYGNGVAETRSFDLDYRLLDLSDTGATALQNLTYAYDAANNVSKITDGVTAANTQNLGYDVLDHLTGATGNYGNLAYSYSPIGNRLTQTAAGVLTTYTNAPHSNQLAVIKSGATTETLTTTAAGNVSGFSVPFGPLTSLTYNQANRLATASSGAGQLTQYTYDGFGQRIVKLGSITATTLYQYDEAGHLLEENDGHGTSRVDYIYLDDRPIATIQPSIGKLYFLHDDRLGTPQLATDATKTVQWSATYQPFGYTSTGIGAIVQNLRLPGQEFDAETGLYHNGLRDYVPALGRYLESDLIGLVGGPNTYGYARGNPLTETDRHGLAPDVDMPEQQAASDTCTNSWITYFVGEQIAGILNLPLDIESLIAAIAQAGYGPDTNFFSDLVNYVYDQNNLANLTPQATSYSFNPPSPQGQQVPIVPKSPLTWPVCLWMDCTALDNQ
jgi:RHS repeat-associated protein